MNPPLDAPISSSKLVSVSVCVCERETVCFHGNEGTHHPVLTDVSTALNKRRKEIRNRVANTLSLFPLRVSAEKLAAGFPSAELRLSEALPPPAPAAKWNFCFSPP